MITLDTIFATGIHQYCGAHNIGFQKNSRILNGSVHMGFCRKIYYYIRLFLLKQLTHCLSVTNICLDKAEIILLKHWLQSRKISCISQLVQTHYAIIWMSLQHMKYKIAANKSSTASYYNSHKISPKTIIALNGQPYGKISINLPSSTSSKYRPY